MNPVFTLYVFRDQNQIPFYVGITRNFKRRMQSHMREVRGMNRLPKYHKVRKVLALGKTIVEIMVPLEENVPLSEIEKKEINLIKTLRTNGIKLWNLTDGGEGAIATIPGISEKLSRIHKGRKRSPETCRKISEAKKGKKFSDEHKFHLSKARKQRKTTLETRIKMSKASKGKINIKKYKLIDPLGKEYITKNGLTVFCEEHNLSHGNIVNVCNGKRPHSKGWTATRLD